MSNISQGGVITGRPPHSGRALAFSIVGLFLPPLAIAGLIMSIVAYERARVIAAPAGRAIAGIVLGALGCLVLFCGVIFLIGYAIGMSLGPQ